MADSNSLKTSVAALNEALLRPDSVKLARLLHPQLSYGHSNGWIETRADVVADLYNGKLRYNKIDQQLPQVVMEGKTASVRTGANVDVTLDGKQILLKLHILQLWIWKEGRWQLLSRQSVKTG